MNTGYCTCYASAQHWVESPGKPSFFLFISSFMDKPLRCFYLPSLSVMLLMQTCACKYISGALPSGHWDTDSESKFLDHRVILCSRLSRCKGPFLSDAHHSLPFSLAGESFFCFFLHFRCLLELFTTSIGRATTLASPSPPPVSSHTRQWIWCLYLLESHFVFCGHHMFGWRIEFIK